MTTKTSELWRNSSAIPSQQTMTTIEFEHNAVTCHDSITTENLLPCTQRCHPSWSHCQSLAMYTVLSPVMIPLLLAISRPLHSVVTCHDPITTANLLPCTQRCHVSLYYCQSLALYTALSPVMIPLPLPISCPVHSAVTCHDPILVPISFPVHSAVTCHDIIDNLLPCTQRCHHSVNNGPVKRLTLVARMPPAFYIGPHAGWSYGIVTPFS